MSIRLNPLYPQRLIISLIFLSLWATLSNDLTAEAKKKVEAGPDPAAQAEAELKKNLDPISTQLNALMIKIESRALLSPSEAGQLADLKYKLLDLINQPTPNALVSKPVYQAGVLFSEREEFNDAYELFNYLAQNFPTTSYGAKAKGQLQQLEKRFGASYFSVAAAGAAPTTTPATADAGSASPAASATTPGKK